MRALLLDVTSQRHFVARRGNAAPRLPQDDSYRPQRRGDVRFWHGLLIGFDAPRISRVDESISAGAVIRL
jgi:hypothetical protein